MSDLSVMMNWQEDQPSRNGPGISRPIPGARTAMYDLRVRPVHGKAMKVTLRAESSKLAKKYAEARWPEAKVEIL